MTFNLHMESVVTHQQNPGDYTLLDRLFPWFLGVIATAPIGWMIYRGFRERAEELEQLPDFEEHRFEPPKRASAQELRNMLDEWLPLAQSAELLPHDFDINKFEAFIADAFPADFDVRFVDFLSALNEFSLDRIGLTTFEFEAPGRLPHLFFDYWKTEEEAALYSYLLREADRISDGALELKDVRASEEMEEKYDLIDVRLEFVSRDQRYDWTIHTLGKWIDHSFIDRLCSLVNQHAAQKRMYLAGDEELVLIVLDDEMASRIAPHMSLELPSVYDLHSPLENRRG
ncbi:hypothetical protein ABVF61_24255 [Roseibium sp. HPY-6]|uniref:hypothetical protein n=1 Tax=Roseibium sp. HPY-6 TaxID=3229852 RepID=UPI003390222B